MPPSAAPSAALRPRTRELALAAAHVICPQHSPRDHVMTAQFVNDVPDAHRAPREPVYGYPNVSAVSLADCAAADVRTDTAHLRPPAAVRVDHHAAAIRARVRQSRGARRE